MRTPRFLLICAFVLSAALMGACNLTQQEERLPTATPTTMVSTKPVVTIISPASGVEHRVNTELLVTANVRDDIGVDRVQMTANGSPVKTIASDSSSGDTDKNVILNYTPLVTGDVTLAVTAFRGAVASDPAILNVRVVASQPTATTGIIVTQGPSIDPNDPTCRALINSGLNFRTGPGTNYPIITTLAQGAVIPVTGRLGDNSWYQLNNFGTFGWVSGAFVSLYGSFCVSVPVIAAPPTPTPNVTATASPTITPSPTSSPTLTATPGIADLVINIFEGEEDIEFPSGGETNEEYSITVSNIGTRRTGDFTVSLQLRPDGEIRTVNVANLRPGESAAVLIDYTFDTAGNFILEAIVDAGQVVTEISEANNKAQLAISVTEN